MHMLHNFWILRENVAISRTMSTAVKRKGKNVAGETKKKQASRTFVPPTIAKLGLRRIGIAQPWATSWQDEKR